MTVHIPAGVYGPGPSQWHAEGRSQTSWVSPCSPNNQVAIVTDLSGPQCPNLQIGNNCAFQFRGS